MEGSMLVKRVEQIDERVRLLVKRNRGSSHTSGGMDTKLEAATIANLCGIPVRIASGRRGMVISDIAKGKDIVTFFVPVKKVETSRKRWILGKPIKGIITVDDGAKEAIMHRGKSLLSVGVVNTSGEFRKIDTVAVVDESGEIIGYGLIGYDSEDFNIALQKKFGREIIHRDNFIKAESGWSYHPYRRFSQKRMGQVL